MDFINNIICVVSGNIMHCSINEFGSNLLWCPFIEFWHLIGSKYHHNKYNIVKWFDQLSFKGNKSLINKILSFCDITNAACVCKKWKCFFYNIPYKKSPFY